MVENRFLMVFLNVFPLCCSFDDLPKFFRILISLKKNNSKIEIWDSENFWLELEIVVSEKLQKNKQTNIRLHLETAALPTELYPCICVKLFSLQAFCLREVSYHKRTPKVKIFWKIVVSFRQVFWTVVNCRKIKRHQEEGDPSVGSEWYFFLQKSSACWPHFPCTETAAYATF